MMDNQSDGWELLVITSHPYPATRCLSATNKFHETQDYLVETVAEYLKTMLMKPRVLLLVFYVLLPCTVVDSFLTPSHAAGDAVGHNIVPLTPKQRVAWDKAGLLELRARAARNRGDWDRAAADYYAETQVPNFRVAPWTWGELGLMLDRLGKRQEAFSAYNRGYIPHRGLIVDSGPEGAEIASRFGILCADKGLYDRARDCYYASGWLHQVRDTTVVASAMNSQKSPSVSVRMLLEICLGSALEGERFERIGRWSSDSKANAQANLREAVWCQDRLSQALAAFRKATRLAPDDPLPQLYVAEALRYAKRFAEAKAVLQRMARLHTNSDLTTAMAKSFALIRQKSLD